MSLPPVVRTLTVRWDPAAAFRRFTAEIGTWWPYRTHSVGGKKVSRIVFEDGVGGRIFEDHSDGRRFQWGTVLEWDPPRRVRFTWHPADLPERSTDVVLTFAPAGGGTRLELVHSGWERLGSDAVKASKGYHVGWKYVLLVWAGRRTPFVLLLDVIAGGMQLVQRIRQPPGDPRDLSKGEITATR